MKKFFTFANPVVNYHPQKDDPNHIWIIAMGNLIPYNSELSIHALDIKTAKLHWNSVVSTPHAKYMCLDIYILSHCGPRVFQIHENALEPVP
jgi:hypothetical protein